MRYRLLFIPFLAAAFLAGSATAQSEKPGPAAEQGKKKEKGKDDPSDFELSLPEVPDAHSNNPALNNLLEQPYVAPEVPDEVEADYQARDPNDPEKINEELAQKKTKEKFDIMSKVGGGIKTRSEGAKGGTLSKGGRES